MGADELLPGFDGSGRGPARDRISAEGECPSPTGTCETLRDSHGWAVRHTCRGHGRNRRIEVPRPLRQAGAWTVGRIDDQLAFAEAFGRTIGLETARVIVLELLDLDPNLEPQDYAAESPADRPKMAPLAFAYEGAIDDGAILMAQVAARAHRARDPLAFAARYAALDAFVDAVPTGPHVWTMRPDATTGWVSLAGSAPDAARPRSRGERRVLGHCGFRGLGIEDVVQHETAARHREGRDDAWHPQQQEPTLIGVEPWRRLAHGLLAHGDAYVAYATGCLFWQAEGEFEHVHRGPVASREAFCFSIGMRDGWWLEHEAHLARLGLRGVAELDLTRMWDFYSTMGWEIAPDRRGGLHLFAPEGHVGPPPGLAEIRAQAAAQAIADEIADERANAMEDDRDANDDWDDLP